MGHAKDPQRNTPWNGRIAYEMIFDRFDAAWASGTPSLAIVSVPDNSENSGQMFFFDFTIPCENE